MRIESIMTNPLGKPERGGTQTLAESIGRDFGELLDEVNRLHHAANQKVEQFATTSEKDIHGTLIAMERAGISMDMLLRVRTKLIDAYHEITRMQF